MMRSLSSLLLGGMLLFGTVSSFSNNTTYYLNSYSVGAGSGTNFSNGTYSGQASLGETAATNPVNGTSNVSEAGGVQTEQLAIPQAPTLNNGSGTYYNQLGFILSNSMGSSTYPSDVTFSVEVSNSSSFTSPSFVQTGGVLSGTALYQTYALWGGSSGSTMVNLTPGLTYYVRVNAKQGMFTNTEYGPSQNATLTNPSITFSMSPNSITLSNLVPNAVISTNPTSNVSFTMATNAAYGGNISGAGLYGGLHSPSINSTIQAPTYGNSLNLTTSADGFGLQDISALGGLTAQTPYSLGGNTVGSDSTAYESLFSASSPIPSGSSATLAMLAKASSIDPGASDYQETFSFVAAASF
jgi:hypothetical protein